MHIWKTQVLSFGLTHPSSLSPHTNYTPGVTSSNFDGAGLGSCSVADDCAVLKEQEVGGWWALIIVGWGRAPGRHSSLMYGQVADGSAPALLAREAAGGMKE